MDYLTAALENAKSRPRILLEAMGARTTRTNLHPNRPMDHDNYINIGTIHTTSASTPTSTSSSADYQIHLPANLDVDTNNEVVEVECRRCLTEGPESGARAFVKGPNPLSIVVCSNRIFSRSDMEQVLVHELIHVHDVRLLGMELRSCTELAYSEIRAAREAECYNYASWLPQQIPHHCIQKRATVATNNLFPKTGAECVRQMMHLALPDTRPFLPFTPPLNTATTSTTQTTDASHHTSPFSATNDDTINGQPYRSSYSAEFTAKTASTFSS
jgi:hypothetical protein